MRRLVILIVLAMTGAESMGVEVKLDLVDDANASPYHYIHYTIRNDAARGSISSIMFRMAEGGPAFVVPAFVPAGESFEGVMALPALSPQQAYDVVFAGGSVRLPVAIPPQRVRPQDTVNAGLYADFEGAALAWPPAGVRELFLAAVLLCVVLAATTLVRRPAVRIAAALAVALAAAGAALLYLESQPLVQERLVADANGQEMLVLATRRTGHWSYHEAPLIPLYADAAQLAADRTLIDAGAVNTELTPDRVRLFRVAAPKPAR